MPTSHSPSRRVPGTLLRAAQPKRSAPVRHASVMWRDEKGSPDVGSLSGSLRSRSAIGSMSSATASSSIADSSAKVPTDSPGARMNVLASMFIFTVSTDSLMLSAA